jgi:hypothetical protein
VEKVGADTFVKLTAELFALLAERDCQGVLTLADHLGGWDWWDDHLLDGPETTVARLECWAGRLKVVASAANCLLGIPGVLPLSRRRGLSDGSEFSSTNRHPEFVSQLSLVGKSPRIFYDLIEKL